MIGPKVFHIGGPTLLVTTLCCLSIAQAKKPNEPPPGGGPGGEVTALYDVLEIPLEDTSAMSDPDDGIITVVGQNRTCCTVVVSKASFVRVRTSDQAIVASGVLPEPEWIDPNTGLPADVASITRGLNHHRTIVGYATIPGTEPNVMEAALWTWDGSAYQLELLPSLGLPSLSNGRYASAINNLGEIVGGCDDRAVYWDPITLQITDLNNAGLEAQGWYLREATDINDSGQIVGVGLLDGQFRGFLLDADGQIDAVPLVGTAIDNEAYKTDEFGRVIGWGSVAPGFENLQAYSWDGPGTDATLLPSTTGANSLASGLNDLGEVVGRSQLPGGTASDSVATLWDIDASGQITATDLNSVVDSRWTLLSGRDCNNDGWISVRAKQPYRGVYRWNTVLLIPRP